MAYLKDVLRRIRMNMNEKNEKKKVCRTKNRGALQESSTKNEKTLKIRHKKRKINNLRAKIKPCGDT